MAIAERSGGLLFAGMVIMDTSTSAKCTVEVYDGHDPQLRAAFEIAGRRRIDAALLDEIDQHTQTMYLIGDAPSPQAADQMRRFAAGILAAGGLAVKVETAGIAWSGDDWNLVGDVAPRESLQSLFTTYVGSEDLFYSCGMKNFGLPDVSVPTSIPANAAAQLMQVFNLYQLEEQPQLRSGHTFSAASDQSRFLLKHLAYVSGYVPDNPLNNPYGRWHLEPLAHLTSR